MTRRPRTPTTMAKAITVESGNCTMSDGVDGDGGRVGLGGGDDGDVELEGWKV